MHESARGSDTDLPEADGGEAGRRLTRGSKTPRGPPWREAGVRYTLSLGLLIT